MNQILNRSIGLYMIVFSIYSLASRFTLTSYVMDGTINNMCYRLLLVIGCLLALWLFLTVKKSLFTKDIAILTTFIASLCVGIISNHAYGLMDNLYGLVTFGFQIILFYLLSRVADHSYFDTWIQKILLFSAILWDIAVLISIYQYLMNISYLFQFAKEEEAVRQGLVDGRLFGTFSDPNFAAFTSLLLCFGLYYIAKNTAHKILRVYAYVSIIINCIYIVLSNSRTVYLSVVGTVLFFSLFRAYKTGQKKDFPAKQMLLSLLKCAILTVICLIVAYFIILFPLQGVAKTLAPERNTETEMVRDDVNDGNISNNRFTIWQSYLELSKEKPFFGYSFRSAIPYAEKNHPGGYLDTTKYVTHNSYISLFVETGLVGFLLMAVFFVFILIRVLFRCRKKEPVSDLFLLFMTWLVAILIFGICFHDIFFTMNFETLLFWMGLGYLWKNTIPSDADLSGKFTY